MQIGVQIPDFTFPAGPGHLGADLAAIAGAADDAGFGFLAVSDHFLQIGMLSPPERGMLEAFTALGYLAACTTRVQLLTLVTGAIYRHPGILAKTVTTLDVLSGGRAWLGIGAAWNDEEARGLGVRFPRRPSGSSGWRKRCRSACRCGAATSRPIPAGTTSWNGQSTRRRRCPAPTRRS